jgi:hypothetical protein
LAETFGKRQRGQRKKERKLNKKQRKEERGNAPEMTERDIARDYFDGFDPNEKPSAQAIPEDDSSASADDGKR